jgi:hypothetical protein
MDRDNESEDTPIFASLSSKDIRRTILNIIVITQKAIVNKGCDFASD